MWYLYYQYQDKSLSVRKFISVTTEENFHSYGKISA